MAEEVQPLAPGNTSGRPSWMLPVIIVLVVGVLIVAGRKNSDVIENPIVEFAILTIGVFAFAAAFRFVGVKAGWPGLAVFFGGQPTKD